jgi:hypothetical protein
MMVKKEPWGLWHSHALAAGVSIELASLGRAVIRNFWQHLRDHGSPVGDRQFLGADRHHAMMIALAKQQPDLAKACFEAARAATGQDDLEMSAALKMIEGQYAVDSIS